MALNAYLNLKGQKSGDINGSVTQKGREHSIMVIPTYERLSFTYQSIEWTWKDGGITAQDTWAQSR